LHRLAPDTSSGRRQPVSLGGKQRTDHRNQITTPARIDPRDRITRLRIRECHPLGTPLGLVFLVRLARDRQVMGTRLVSGRLAAGRAVALLIGGLSLLFAVSAILT
jgi:hypothetical protein